MHIIWSTRKISIAILVCGVDSTAILKSYSPTVGGSFVPMGLNNSDCGVSFDMPQSSIPSHLRSFKKVHVDVYSYRHLGESMKFVDAPSLSAIRWDGLIAPEGQQVDQRLFPFGVFRYSPIDNHNHITSMALCVNTIVSSVLNSIVFDE